MLRSKRDSITVPPFSALNWPRSQRLHTYISVTTFNVRLSQSYLEFDILVVWVSGTVRDDVIADSLSADAVCALNTRNHERAIIESKGTAHTRQTVVIYRRIENMNHQPLESVLHPSRARLHTCPEQD